jgi:hypothetical protein
MDMGLINHNHELGQKLSKDLKQFGLDLLDLDDLNDARVALGNGVGEIDAGLQRMLDRAREEKLRYHAILQLQNLQIFVESLDTKGFRLSIENRGYGYGLFVDGKSFHAERYMKDPGHELLCHYDDEDNLQGDPKLYCAFLLLASVIENAQHGDLNWASHLVGKKLN